MSVVGISVVGKQMYLTLFINNTSVSILIFYQKLLCNLLLSLAFLIWLLLWVRVGCKLCLFRVTTEYTVHDILLLVYLICTYYNPTVGLLVFLLLPVYYYHHSSTYNSYCITSHLRRALSRGLLFMCHGLLVVGL